MSLVRTALVIGVAVYAMPTDPEKQQALIRSASDTVVWGATYCQREPDTCREAGVILNEAVQKAKFGVALASDLATKWSEQHKAPEAAPNATGASQSTLTIEDALAASPDDVFTPVPPAQAADLDPSVKG